MGMEFPRGGGVEVSELFLSVAACNWSCGAMCRALQKGWE